MSERSPEEIVSAELLRQALSDDHAWELSFAGLRYVRFSDDVHGVPRGTVISEGKVVPAYPPIGRIFALARGIEKSFTGRFLVEEKVDGYNVRIVLLDGRLVPFTRGGFVCPFTDDRMADLGAFEPLLAANPDLVLCGEVVGEGNPYMAGDSPRVDEDVRFFAFDLMRLGRRDPIPLEQRDRLFGRFGIASVPRLGWFMPADVERIRAEVLRLDAEGAEGIILKPEAAGLRVKYVTPTINVADIALDGPLLAELPPEFFLGRLLRLAMGIEELRLHERIAREEQRIGQALLSGFLPIVREVRVGKNVTRTFRVRLHSDAAADRLMVHLNRASKKVQVREMERRREGGWTHLTFEKTFLASTARLKGLLDGDYVID